MSEHKSHHRKHKIRPERKALNMMVRYQPSVQDNRIYAVRLTFQQLITSNGLGIINTVCNMAPNGSSEWSINASLYDDFRVMGMRARIFSLQQFSLTALNAPTVLAYDDNNSTALTSFDSGVQYNTHHVFPAVFSHTIVPIDRDCCLEYLFMRPTSGSQTAIVWTDTSNPTNAVGALKLYASGVSNTTNYFTITYDWYVQFRGRS